MKTLHIGLASWIIQDGNYGDFRAGQTACFALEFAPDSLAANGAPVSPQLQHASGAIYRVRGLILYTHPKVWVCDFGVLAYHSGAPPSWVGPGIQVAGTLYLGVDPFFYFEDLYRLPGIPQLKYEFRVRRILLETTPWVEDPQCRNVFRRDASRQAFREVAQTKAWDDDGGHGHYVLECELKGPAA